MYETEERVKRDAMLGSLNPGVVKFESWNVEHDGIVVEFDNVQCQ